MLEKAARTYVRAQFALRNLRSSWKSAIEQERKRITPLRLPAGGCRSEWDLKELEREQDWWRYTDYEDEL